MTVQTLISIFTVLLTISLSAERLIEAGKPLFEKIADLTVQASVKLLSAIVIGVFLAALFRFDLLAQMGVVGLSYWIGYLAAGLITSTGSTTINRLLAWLKTLKEE